MLKNFLVLLFFAFIPVAAQDYMVTQYSDADGLAHSQILSIAQDHDGILWVGTNGGGISKFDGNTFSNLSLKDGLSDNMIYAIYHAENGNTWVGTSSGLSLIKNRRIHNLVAEYGSSRVNRIITDRNGGMWIADNTNGLIHYNGNTFRKWNSKNGLAHNSIKDFSLATDGNLWIGTLNGLSRFDGEKFHNYTKSDGLLEDYISSVFIDKKGKIYIGHSTGLTIITPVQNGFKFEKIQTDIFIYSVFQDKYGSILIASKNGLFSLKDKKFEKLRLIHSKTDFAAGTFFEDYEGNIWLGTDGAGLFKIRKTNFSNWIDKTGFHNEYVWSITEDNKGSIWVGTNNNGVVKIDKDKLTSYTMKEGLPDNQVFSTYKRKNGDLLFGTTGGLSLYNGRSFKTIYKEEAYNLRIILNITEDTQGNIWLGTISGVLKYDGKEFKTYTLGVNEEEMGVFFILQDNTGKIWFFSEDEGVFILENNKFKQFIPHEIFDKGQVWCAAQDDKNNFWFGHWGKGLIFFNTKDSSLKFITEIDGLLENSVTTMKYDGKKFLWLGTNKGISRLNVEEFYNSGRIIIHNFTSSEGFTGLECNQGASFIDSKGNIWFGHNLGVSKYNPTLKYDVFNTFEPKLKLYGVDLFYQPTDYTKYSTGIDSSTGLPINLRLPYDKNFLQFSFVGVSLTIPENVLYKYKLEGLDSTWSPATKYNFANYTNLSPGSYKFLLIACNNNGMWNSKPLEFSFVITPPFWWTWWFITISVGSIFTLIFLFFHIRIKNIEKRNEIIRKSEERLNLVVKGSNDAPWDYDMEKKEFYYSPQWWEMIGYSPNELPVSSSLQFDLIHPDDKEDYLEKIQKVLDGNNTSYELEFRLKHKDGHYIPVLLRGFVLRDSNNKPIRISGTNMDLTERKRVERVLIEAKEKAEEMNRIKSYFFANMSHELRTPFVGIMSYAEVLSKSLTDLDAKRMAEVIFNSSKRMKDTLTKILDLTRVELIRTKLEIKEVDISSVIEDVTNQYIKTAERNGVKIIKNVKPEGLVVKTDENLFCGILNNLISNAVKFTNKGSISVTVEFDNKNGSLLELFIKDTGVGIPAEKRSIIWDEFRQASEGLNRKFEGTGLGLTIVKKYVEYLNGKITVESIIGEGTTFLVSFPVEGVEI
jgi:PAS domain S-box-containing protein